MSTQESAIITGAYGAIGLAICEGLIQQGFSITMAGRDKNRLEEAAAMLIRKTGLNAVEIYALDLGCRAEVERFSNEYNKPCLSVLVNNAATTPKQRTLTKEGIEVQFAVNVLGYFWMMHYFHSCLKTHGNSRIVNVASYWAGGLDFDDLEFTERRYDPDTAYRQSKQADRMLSAAMAEVYKEDGVAVNSCHPGDVNSKLSNSMGFGGHETPAEGAATPLFVACSKDLSGITGKYFESMRLKSCPFTRDVEGVRRLLQVCREYTGLK